MSAYKSKPDFLGIGMVALSGACFGMLSIFNRQLCGGGLVIAAVILLSTHGTSEAASVEPIKETTP